MIRTLLTTALLLAPAVASAQDAPQCFGYTDFASALATNYGESVLERGLSSAGTLIEWWGNPETGTWTLLVVTPAGLACMIADGQSYETFEPIAAGTDS